MVRLLSRVVLEITTRMTWNQNHPRLSRGVALWKSVGGPFNVRVVELGPGRGTLMKVRQCVRGASIPIPISSIPISSIPFSVLPWLSVQDALKVMRKWNLLYSSLAVHLVEASPALREIQAQTLGCSELRRDDLVPGLSAWARRADGLIVNWHDRVEDIPHGGMLILYAQEFFDAMPVHQLIRTAEGWRERVVEWDEASKQFRLGVASSETPAARFWSMEGRFWRPMPPLEDAIAATSVVQTIPLDAGVATDHERALEGAGEGEGEGEGEWIPPPQRLPSSWDVPPSSFPLTDGAWERAVAECGTGSKPPTPEPEQGLDEPVAEAEAEDVTKGREEEETVPPLSPRRVDRTPSTFAPPLPLFDDLRPAQSESNAPAEDLSGAVRSMEDVLSNITARVRQRGSQAEEEGGGGGGGGGGRWQEPTSAEEWMARAPVGTVVEISPISGAVARNIAERVGEEGGGALILDYGYYHGQRDSLRGIRQHKFVDPLETPGEIDLSANVDFLALAKAVEASGAAQASEPITQSQFLQAMGIRTRLMMLVENSEDDEFVERLFSSARRLLHPSEMGRIYKAMSIYHKDDAPPAGFGEFSDEEDEGDGDEERAETER